MNVISYINSNNAKGRISKRVFQENKARQIFRKKKHFLAPDTHVWITSWQK